MKKPNTHFCSDLYIEAFNYHFGLYENNYESMDECFNQWLLLVREKHLTEDFEFGTAFFQNREIVNGVDYRYI